MSHKKKNMEQTINILTERERQLDDIDKAVRDVKYPPLNGGPTLEDLAGLLDSAITHLNIAVASGKLGMCKELEEILGRLMKVRSNLRRV